MACLLWQLNSKSFLEDERTPLGFFFVALNSFNVAFFMMYKNHTKFTTDITEIQWIVGHYHEQLYAKKFENLGKMDKFLETYNVPKLNQKEAESLNRPITASEVETVIKKFMAHKSSGQDCFTVEVYKTFEEELTPIFLRLFKKSKKRYNNHKSINVIHHIKKGKTKFT